MPLKEKFAKLESIILGYDSCLIAFSGGVDSTLLLKVASDVLAKDNVIAVTANSLTYPAAELLQAKQTAKRLGVRHKIINTREFKNKRFIANPINRCYFCKKELFLALKKIALRAGLNYVLDASSLSDKSDFRPGNIAKIELKIKSPLQDAGFTKEDIRKLSRELGLDTWDKPSLACLASRIPYGTKISSSVLRRIDKGESYLRKQGFRQVRLRHYNGLCRIEVPKAEIPRLITKRAQLVNRLKKTGYNYITIDLEGYRTGSMNEVIKR